MTPPRVLRINPSEPEGAELEKAAVVLAGGGVIAHPTETLYGLAVDPWNGEAVNRLAALKGRRANAGFILIAATRTEASALIAEPPPAHFATLARAFWPGALTLVVPSSPAAPRGVLGRNGDVAVRVTSDPVARALVRAFGKPITSSSANRAGEIPASSAGEILSRLGGEVDLILDGGPGEGRESSTLVDLTGRVPRIIREGAIGRGRIEEIIGGVVQ